MPVTRVQYQPLSVVENIGVKGQVDAVAGNRPAAVIDTGLMRQRQVAGAQLLDGALPIDQLASRQVEFIARQFAASVI